MQRLTAKRCNGIKAGYWSPAKKEDIIQRLGAYEDTGLEPEEIRNGNGWISVADGMPKEKESCFNRYYGTPEWVEGMFRTVSDPVLACVVYEDGRKAVHEMSTHDGEWHISSIWGKCKVSHWMEIPRPPKEVPHE